MLLQLAQRRGNVGFVDGGQARALADAGVSFFVANSFSKSFSLYGERVGGRSVVVVEVTADLPVLGPWGIGEDLTVRGRALQEGE